MTDLKKLIASARSREDEPTAHEYIEPLCFALEGAMSEIEMLRNAPEVKLQAAELAEAFSKPKDDDGMKVIPDHAFNLHNECQEPGCGQGIEAHGSSVWLQSMRRVRVETLKWAYKQCFSSEGSPNNPVWIGSRRIWAEVERLEGKGEGNR
jgi:hypothetical protein